MQHRRLSGRDAVRSCPALAEEEMDGTEAEVSHAGSLRGR